MLNGQEFAVTGLNNEYFCIMLFVSRVTYDVEYFRIYS